MICVADHIHSELIYELTVNILYIKSVGVKIIHQNKRILASKLIGHLILTLTQSVHLLRVIFFTENIEPLIM